MGLEAADGHVVILTNCDAERGVHGKTEGQPNEREAKRARGSIDSDLLTEHRTEGIANVPASETGAIWQFGRPQPVPYLVAYLAYLANWQPGRPGYY